MSVSPITPPARPEDQLRTPRNEFQRAQIFAAIVDLSCDQGFEALSVGEIAARAGVSKRAFYELFANRQQAALASLEDAVTRISAQLSARYKRERVWTYVREQAWAERIRAGLRALLELFDEEPRLARFCVITSGQLAPQALAYRAALLQRLAMLIDQGRVAARREPPPLTAETLVGGALTIIQRRLLDGSREPLSALLNPLMAAIVFPYLGGVQAATELSRPVPWRTSWRVSPQTPAPPPIRLTHRRLPALLAIAKDPGLSNLQVAQAAGITDPGQISKLLSCLKDAGVIQNTGGGHLKGEANAWMLTPTGHELLRSVQARRGLAGGAGGAAVAGRHAEDFAIDQDGHGALSNGRSTGGAIERARQRSAKPRWTSPPPEP